MRRYPDGECDAPTFEWLASAIRFLLGFVQIVAALAWPWLTQYLLYVTVPKNKPGFMPLLTGCLLFGQIFTAVIAHVVEVGLRTGFDPNDSDDPLREAASERRRHKSALAASGVFLAFTLWFNSHYVTRAGFAEMMRECGALASLIWLLLVVAPPIFWFTLNMWRWHNLIKRR